METCTTGGIKSHKWYFMVEEGQWGFVPDFFDYDKEMCYPCWEEMSVVSGRDVSCILPITLAWRMYCTAEQTFQCEEINCPGEHSLVLHIWSLDDKRNNNEY